MSSIPVLIDAVVAWFKSFRAAKAGAELRAGEEAGRVIDTSAANIAGELSKPSKPPQPIRPEPVK